MMTRRGAFGRRVRREGIRACGRSLRGIVLVVLAFCAAGCTREPQKDEARERGARQDAAPLAVDAGDFKLNYAPRKSVRREGDAGRRVGGNQQALEQVIAELNEKVALPYDITVSLEDCPEPSAHYDPEPRKVTVCYQLVDEYYELFSRKIKDPARLEDAVSGATAATFFHELGHALIDAWGVPITGREEDAVDQLSTLVLLGRSERGERMALDGAVSFLLYASLSEGQEQILWDEHSLDEQRFYDTVCLIYGRDPERYKYLVQDGTLPRERAEFCGEEYERVSHAWQTLLAPILKAKPQRHPAEQLPPQQQASDNAG